MFTNRDIGYTISSRVELAFREFIGYHLLESYGPKWREQIPKGVWKKVLEKLTGSTPEDFGDPQAILHATDFPDLAEIIGYKDNYSIFDTGPIFKKSEFLERMHRFYELRCLIAHPQKFGAYELDLLRHIATDFLPLLDAFGKQVRSNLERFNEPGADWVLALPVETSFGRREGHLTNLPANDYDPDGGFIGRKQDLDELRKLVFDPKFRVITITGAGGVGKTALAHKFCEEYLKREEIDFSAVIWMSAKQEELTSSGIRSLTPNLRTYEDLLDTILSLVDWDSGELALIEKREIVDLLLGDEKTGMLLVIDNLEAVADDADIREMLINLPLPNKALITSRIGLGEVERKYQLREMSRADAIALARKIASEKGLVSFSNQPDATVLEYAEQWGMYPLAIKWALGQAALGKDLNSVTKGLAKPSGDLARFTFDSIFDHFIDDSARKILFCLALSEEQMTAGVISHVTQLSQMVVEDSMGMLTISSMVTMSHLPIGEGTLETRYGLLPLTKSYLLGKLDDAPSERESLRERLSFETGSAGAREVAERSYQLNIKELGAVTQEEKAAAFLVISGAAKYRQGQHHAGQKEFEQAAAIAPHFAAVYQVWAEMEDKSGEPKFAARLIAKALELGPDKFSVLLTAGNIEKRGGNLDRALLLLSKAIEIDPNNSFGLCAAGSIEKRIGNFDRAEALLLRALETGESFGNKHVAVCSTALSDNYRLWARELKDTGDLAAAAKVLHNAHEYAKRAIDEANEDQDSRDNYRQVCFDIGVLLARASKMEAARTYFQKCISTENKSRRERQHTVRSCLYLANLASLTGDLKSVERFLAIGGPYVPYGKWEAQKYEEASMELTKSRIVGTITELAYGTGRVLPEGSFDHDSSALLLPKNIIPFAPSASEFAAMGGKRISYIEAAGKSGRPIAVRAFVVP